MPRKKFYPDPFPVTRKAQLAWHERRELERMLAEYHAARKKERAESPERIKIRIKQIIREYKITESDIEQMLKSQGRRCAICEDPFNGLDCHVDHNHITGKVRGLLCGRCNTRIGGWDDPEWARAAAAYLGIIPKLKNSIELDLERRRASTWMNNASDTLEKA